MIIENDPSARMQVRSRGDLVAPACCMVCGNGTHEEGYLDLGAFIDFHGTCYLCMTCLTQAGETIGMFTPEEVKHFQAQIESLIAQKDTLELELNNVTEHRDALDNALRLAYGGTSSDSLSVGAADVPEAVGRSDSGESEPKEPVTLAEPAGTSGTKLRDITFD